MGTMWISWRTATTVIIIILQIQALISVRTTAVTGVEGQPFYFRYKHNQWVTVGRFSVYDNTTGAFFIVRVDELSSDDSGTYWCGVDISLHPDEISAIQLDVSRGTELTIFQNDFPVDKLHLPLYLIAVMCVAAILCVCLFTFSLLLALNCRRSGIHQHSETSSNYETTMPGVGTEHELHYGCSDPDCADLSGSPPPLPDAYSHFTSNHQDAPGLSEYVDVDVPGHICHYQHLDLSCSEEHIYHRLHVNNGPKDEPLGVKDHINC
uniref:uncharacterized protein LOC124068848 isoform X2 n=1 Tax=Scatophagus argus TaxID=75038 RepID=UPI001ED81897|nr:uncharacterized protein LOC124068848 isoform X2 [Scatophagus argus]